MLYRDIAKVLGFFFFGFTLALLIPLVLSIYYQFWVPAHEHPQPHVTWAFVETIGISGLIAAGLYWIGRSSHGQLFRREGLAAVVIIWFFTPAIAGLPFFLSGTLENPVQAYFEATSGLTTTGATCMTAKRYDPRTHREIPIKQEVHGVNDVVYTFYGNITPVRDPQTGRIVYQGIEAVSRALLFWRSFMQWLGGVGIVVLFAAILPVLGVGGKMLFQAEVTGPVKESLTPRIKETAIQLWKIYMGLTLIEIVLLYLVNPKLTPLEIVTVAFSTLSTGGFSVKNMSIGAFHSPGMEWIVMLFMLLGSINFSIYFYILRGKLYRVNQPEFWLYLVLLTFSCSLSAWYLVGSPRQLLTGITEGVYSVSEAIRIGFFQVISAQTSTGFVVANYDEWPYPVQMIMIVFMYVGGMSGSTAGGMKIIRHFMLFRIIQFKVESLFRPETVKKFRIGGKEVDTGASMMVLCYSLTVIAIAVLATFFYVVDGIDFESAIGLTSCMINNTGIGFRMDGPLGSCAFLSDFGLLLSSAMMVLGRLEFFAVLAILVPAFWKQH